MKAAGGVHGESDAMLWINNMLKKNLSNLGLESLIQCQTLLLGTYLRWQSERDSSGAAASLTCPHAEAASLIVPAVGDLFTDSAAQKTFGDKKIKKLSLNYCNFQNFTLLTSWKGRWAPVHHPIIMFGSCATEPSGNYCHSLLQLLQLYDESKTLGPANSLWSLGTSRSLATSS